VAFFSDVCDFKEVFSGLLVFCAVLKKEANSFSAFALLDLSNGYSCLKFYAAILAILIVCPPK